VLSWELEQRAVREIPPSDSRESPDLAAAIQTIPFQEVEKSGRHLARALHQLSPKLAAALPALLAEAPDPDAAVLFFSRLLDESDPQVLSLLNQHPTLAHYAIALFGHSRFLGETLLRNPDLLGSFLNPRSLDQSYSREEFQNRLAHFRAHNPDEDIACSLARFKRMEYVRIVLRDVLGIAAFAETAAEISSLADVLIEEGLRQAENCLQGKYGSRWHLDSGGRLVGTGFAVLSLGKLGGNELNYSSDVDLLYLFADDGAELQTGISNREYFIRLAQQLTRVLSRQTPEGPVYRIDLRLRPQGREGELAISLGQALRYYTRTAEDWERQALIKIRRSAGDERLAREFIRGVQPQVYGLGSGEEKAEPRPLNFAAIKTALVARERMDRHRRFQNTQEGTAIDVKLDHGGIRDIEFLVQCLQRVHGGRDAWLRSGGTLFSLHRLHDKGSISGKDFHALSGTYEFLRNVEHRLQLRRGQQTHRLPTSPAELEILRRSMEKHALSGERGPDLVEAIRARMAAVSTIYKRVIFQQQVRERREAGDVLFALQAGVEAVPGDAPNAQILERLAEDSPQLHATLRRSDLSPQARKNALRFVSAAFASSERYGALLRQPEALARALSILHASEYLTDILVRHPEEIAALAVLEDVPASPPSFTLFDPQQDDATRSDDPVFSYLASSPANYGEKLSLLRTQYRHRMFLEGARDVYSLRDVYSSLRATTAAAEDAVRAAFGIAGSPSGVAVMGLGGLGSREFDICSDADLLFVCEDSGLSGLARSAERIVQALAAYTQDGTVFPVDTRLRPRGEEGDLLVSVAQLRSYFAREAQPWEALMFTKLRYLAGDANAATQAIAATKNLFARFAQDPDFTPATREMRQKLESSGQRNFKASPGALYDVDFITGYLLVKHGARSIRSGLRDRIWQCADAGFLPKNDAAVLDHASELVRTTEHVVRLAGGKAIKWLPAMQHQRQVTQELAGSILQQRFSQGLEAELERTFRMVRQVYDRIIA